MVPSSYCVILTLHVNVLLSHSVVPLFFLTFDGTILTLYNINIICDCAFVTFGGFLIFLSHLIVPSLHYVVLTSYVTVLLSHLVVLFFFSFSHIWWFSFFFLTFDGIILTLCNTNITCDCTFITLGGSLIFFLTFDDIIFTLYSTNITCDCTFVTFSNSLIFFSNI